MQYLQSVISEGSIIFRRRCADLQEGRKNQPKGKETFLLSKVSKISKKTQKIVFANVWNERKQPQGSTASFDVVISPLKNDSITHAEPPHPLTSSSWQLHTQDKHSPSHLFPPLLTLQLFILLFFYFALSHYSLTSEERSYGVRRDLDWIQPCYCYIFNLWLVTHGALSSEKKTKKKLECVCIRCEKYFLCGNNVRQLWSLFKNRTARNPRDQRGPGSHRSVYLCLNLLSARHDQSSNQTSLGGNVESWRTSETSNFSFPKCEDKTVDHREKGAWRAEGRKRGESKPLMSKTFLFGEEGLTLKYSGWRWMGDWPMALISATHWGTGVNGG